MSYITPHGTIIAEHEGKILKNRCLSYEHYASTLQHLRSSMTTIMEIDIWWLLTYRASLYYSKQYNCHKLIKNQIVYYDVGMEINKKLKSVLENMAVKYEFYLIPQAENEYFLQQYMKIAKSMGKNMRA